MTKRFFILLASVLLVACNTGTTVTQQIDLYAPIPVDTAVRTGTLPNGMRYYIRHNDKPAGQANFHIYHNVGAIQEEDSQDGLAHFLEHMAFNGTRNLPGKMIIDYLETIGVKFGSNLNAATSQEYTSYMMTNVPLLREGIIDTALLILHDWSHFITLDGAEIDKERGVIVEEMRGRISGSRRVSEASWPLIYNDSKYARRNVIGSEKLIRTFPHQTLRDFYHTWYRPDLQAVMVVGDVDVDRIEQKLFDMMADIPAVENPRPKEPVLIPDNEEPVAGVFTDPELTGSGVTLYIRRGTGSRENNGKPVAFKSSIENNLIQQMLTNRLNEIAMKPEPPFMGASAASRALTRTANAFILSASARPGEIAQAFEALYAEVEKVRLFGFNSGELERAKTSLLRAHEKTYDARNDRKNGDFVSTFIANFTHNSAMPTADARFELNSALINQVTLEQVNERIPQLLSYKNEVVIATGPEQEETPTEEELLEIITDVQGQVLEPYPDMGPTKPLITRRVGKGKVVSEEPGHFGSTVWTLGNGIRFILLPTDYKADQIYLNIYRHGGISAVSDEDYTSAQVLTSLVRMSGVGKFDAVELRRRLAGKYAALNMNLEGRTNGFSTGGSTKDTETIFQLIYLYFTSPRFAREDFDSMMSRYRASYANAESNPITIMNDTVQSVMYPGSFRHTPFRKRMQLVDFERMPDLYESFFGNPGQFTYVMVGDFDPEEIRPLVEKYIGSLKISPEKSEAGDSGVRLQRGRVDNFFSVPMVTPKSTVFYLYSGDLEHTMKSSLTMNLLNRILSMRYTESIREEKGGAYNVRVSGEVNRILNQYTLNVQFTTDPEMVEELIAIISEEIEKIAAAGPRPEDLAKVKEYLAKSRPEGLRSNATWIRFLMSYYLHGVDSYTDYDRVIDEVDGEAIQELAARILADGNLIRVVMSPETETE